MKKNDWIRTLAWAIPLVCFILAGLLVYWQYKRLQTVRKDVATEQKLVGQIQDSLKTFQATGKEKIPASLDSKQEESLFLESVRRLMLSHNVSLVRWINEAPAPTPPGAPDAIKDVKILVSTVEVKGLYADVRAFTNDLLTSQRLLTVFSGTWTRDTQGSESRLFFKLYRYVSTLPAPAVNPSAMANGRSQKRFAALGSPFGRAKVRYRPWRDL